MREVVSEADPAVDLHQEICNLDVGEHPIKRIPECLPFFGNAVLKRADLEARTAQLRIRQLIFPGERTRLIEGFAQQRHALLEICRSRHWNRDMQIALSESPIKLRMWHQIVFECTELAGANHRDIAGTQGILQLSHDAELVEAAVDAF